MLIVFRLLPAFMFAGGLLCGWRREMGRWDIACAVAPQVLFVAWMAVPYKLGLMAAAAAVTALGAALTREKAIQTAD